MNKKHAVAGCRPAKGVDVAGAIMMLAAGAVSVGTAAAQGENSANTVAVGLEEVIVTAQRRAESLQDTAMSITALGDKVLNELGANSFRDFAGFVPGLQLLDAGPDATQIAMRGVTTGLVRNDQPELKETVGLYIDDTPVSVQRFNPNFALYDLERVEVLRGPQGTLYGAGTMAGAIRLITKKPDLTELDGSAQLTVSETEGGGLNQQYDGMVNVPLIGRTLAMRAVGYFSDEGGFIDNTNLGIDDVNDVRNLGGRVQIGFERDKLSANLSMIYQEQEFGSRSVLIAEAGPLATNVDRRETVDDEVFIASLSLDYDLDVGVLTSVSSYFDKKQSLILDAGGLTDFLTGGDDIPGPLFQDATQEEFTQEIRFTTSAWETLNVTAGLFYQHREHFFKQDSRAPGIDEATGTSGSDFGAEPDQLYDFIVMPQSDQYAAFAELTYNASDRLEFTAGARYARFEEETVYDWTGIFLFPQIGVFENETKEDAFNPKLGLSYTLSEDALVFFQAAKGFRLGGASQPLPEVACSEDLASVGLTQAPTSFESDSLWNYEVGAKTAWADNRLQLNASAYFTDWEDPQLQSDFACGFNTYFNGGALEIHGVELEVTAAPLEGLYLRLSTAYTDSELVGDSDFLKAKDGDAAPFTPEFTVSAMAEYAGSIGRGLEGFFNVSFQHVGERFQAFNRDDPTNLNFPAYEVFGARVGVRTDGWAVDLFAENLFDERAILSRDFYLFSETAGTRTYIIRPRTVGIRLSMSLE
jgi:outer membrane receptor protein involved in Fe transport